MSECSLLLSLVFAKNAIDSSAGFTLDGIVRVAIHDKLHPTCLAGAGFAWTLLDIISPFGIAAGENGLVVETHGVKADIV